MRLEQVVLLVTRCLLIILVALALGRPIIDSIILTDDSSRSITFIIDDGMTSGVLTTNEETELDQSIRKAVDIIDSLSASDSISVISTSIPPRLIIHPPTRDHQSVIRFLESMKPSATPADIDSSLRLAGSDDDPDTENVVILLSSFRKGTTTLETTLDSSNLSSSTLLATTPASDQIENVRITGVEPIRKIIIPGVQDGSDHVRVWLTRSGSTSGSGYTKIIMNSPDTSSVTRVHQWEQGQTEAMIDFRIDVPEKQDRLINLVFTIDEDALEVDNSRFSMIDSRENIEIGIINRRDFSDNRRIEDTPSSHWISAALGPGDDDPMEISFIDPASINRNMIRVMDALFLVDPHLVQQDGWSLLDDFIRNGGLVVVTPPDLIDSHAWIDDLQEHLGTGFTATRTTNVHENPVRLAADQPRSDVFSVIGSEIDQLINPIEIHRSITIEPSLADEPILLMEDGSPMVIRVATSNSDMIQSGSLVILSTPPTLGWTNLPAKPLMVPLFQELLRQGISSSGRMTMALSGEPPLLPGTSTMIRDPGGSMFEIDQDGLLDAPILQPGFHEVLDSGGQAGSMLVVNVHEQAGDTGLNDPDEVIGWLESTGRWQYIQDEARVMSNPGTGSSWFSSILFLCALGVAIAELIMARLFSHATISNQNPVDGHPAGARA